MGVVYQLTFFAALAILAILITIFVFAVSLLGRAMEAATSSEKEKLDERKEKNTKEMADIKKDVEKAEASGDIPIELTRKLGKLEKRNREFDRELAKIRRAPAFLTVKGGVLPSSAPLLGALILTGAAWYLSTIENVIWLIPVIIWIVGFAAIGYSIFKIYHCLRVIESVAITSEEVAERRLAQAVKVALRELEEEKKPKLVLVWLDEELQWIAEQSPLKIKAGTEKQINFSLMLMKGIEAKNVSLFVNAPPSFGFPGQQTTQQLSDHSVHPNYIAAEIKCSNVKEGIRLVYDITIKAPTELNEYTLFYRIVAIDFDSKPKPFKVIVY